MKIIDKHCTPLCYLPSGNIVCYNRGYIKVLQNNMFIKSIPIPITLKEKVCGHIKILYRLFRMGIRAAIALDENNIIYSIANSVFELNLKSKKLSNGYYIGDGIRPLIFTTVKGIDGFDDCICFGGYRSNGGKDPVNIYRRVAIDQWEIVYTFEKGTINHVHNIIADPYRKCLWAFTGDFDEASAIWKITDNFKNVKRVLYNNQKYRGCVIFPVQEGLIYATDAPFAQNYIYIMRDDLSVETICEIDGSCIYGCQLGETYALSTAVEPDGRYNSILNLLISRKRGAGIKDKYSHLYIGNFSEGFKEVYKEKKDRWPYLFQFGVIRFPYGFNPTSTLYFQPVATNKHDSDLIMIELINNEHIIFNHGKDELCRK